ncbi:MFS transporter [Pseudonocardia acaciae]|uniref:MFS transporter n=1 Tax=Pseudonocardia acaciae TaxID=551276 RepID=UPI00048B0D27|nr:MFS transporter [Pseudonocardia acaciae]
MTATADDVRPTYNTAWWAQRRYQMLTTNWLTYFVNYLDRVKTSALLPLMAASLALNTAQLGWILFAFYLTYALSQPLAGYVTDVLGARRSLALSAAAFTTFTWTIAFTHTFTDLLVRNAIFGFTLGFEYTAASRLIAMWFPARTRGRAHAIHQTGNTAGAIIAPLVAVPLAEATGSWRWPFVIISFFGLPLLALIHRYVFDRPENSPRVSRAELVTIYGSGGADRVGTVTDPTRARSADELPPGERPISYRQALGNRNVALLASAMFFASFEVWGLSSWLPTYGVQQLGMPLFTAGAMASVFWAGTVLGTLAGGALSDTVFGLKRTPVWLLGGIVAAAAIVAAALLPRGVPAGVLFALLGIAGFFAMWSPLAVLTPAYVAELLTPGVVGRVAGATIFVASIGSAFAQPLAGMLVLHGPDGPQYWPVFLAFAGAAALSALCCFGLVEPSLRRTYLGHLLAGARNR